MLGVTPPTVIKWVTDGQLEAHRTPGGHRRIAAKDLAEFAGRCGYIIGDIGTSIAEPQDGLTRVLIIDREQDFAEMVAEYLQMKGTFRVAHASSAMMAGFFVGTVRPQVVLFDIDATGVDIHALMRLAESARLILLTSLMSPDLESLQSIFEGAKVVEKPVKLDHLLNIIQGN